MARRAPPGGASVAELLGLWKEEDEARREQAAHGRPAVGEFAASKSPWPLDTETGRKEVLEFARAAFRPDDGRRCRLTPDELAEYRRTLQTAQREDAWGWFGLTVYELARRTRTCPNPRTPRLITDPNDLPEAYRRELTKKGVAAGLRINPARTASGPTSRWRCSNSRSSSR